MSEGAAPDPIAVSPLTPSLRPSSLLQPTAKLPPVPGPAGASDPAVGAVVPSVKSALEWLRSATRARPGVRLRVLVTGSLYLVGDVLRHLGRGEQ